MRGRRLRTPATLAFAWKLGSRRAFLASSHYRDSVRVDDRRHCLLAARFAGLFEQVLWSTVCKSLLAGTVLVLLLGVVVLLIETGFATAERRIKRRLLRRSHDLRANLDAIRRELDEMQADSGRDPQS